MGKTRCRETSLFVFFFFVLRITSSLITAKPANCQLYRKRLKLTKLLYK